MKKSKPVGYIIIKQLFRSDVYLGRGTLCWLVREVVDLNATRCHQGSLGFAGKESEAALLLYSLPWKRVPPKGYWQSSLVNTEFSVRKMLLLALHGAVLGQRY